MEFIGSSDVDSMFDHVCDVLSCFGDPTYAPAIIAPATIAPLKATIAPR